MEAENNREESVKGERENPEREMENKSSNQKIMKKKNGKRQEKKMKKKKLSYYFIPKFPCMRIDDESFPAAETPAAAGGFDMEVGCNGRVHSPTHLVVSVNGIIGSAKDWRYAAKQFVKAYPDDVLVHCSESNTSMSTFDGVDVMGKRLADEVISVVERHPNLQKISFVAHSLGGLVARYAIAVLYQQEVVLKNVEENDENIGDESSLEEKPRGNIAGLEPVNFITFATPHLGSRGHKQVPVFCGFYTMERLASHASVVLGRTGRHLFLSDSDDAKAPLLLRMCIDSDLKFISALQSFKRRVAYANARFDYIVGWSSSSLRLRNELPKRRSLQKSAKYPHILNEEKSDGVSSQEEVSMEVKVGRGRTKDMEETMIKGLTRLKWERVDVKFNTSIQRLLAHNTIQVTTQCINSDGADVIQHMIDNFQL